MAKSPKTFTSHSPPRARTLSGPATRRRSTREPLPTRNRAFGPNGVPTTSRQTSATRTDTTSRLPISLGSTNKRYEPSRHQTSGQCCGGWSNARIYVTLIYADHFHLVSSSSCAFREPGAMAGHSRLQNKGGAPPLHVTVARGLCVVAPFADPRTYVRATPRHQGSHVTPVNLSPRMTTRKPAWNKSQFTKPKLTRPAF